MTGDAVARVLDALEQAGARPRPSGDAWEFFCLVHGDGERRAGELRQGDKGALIVCHAGCALDAILAALKLTKSDLFDSPQEPSDRPRIVERYNYTDEDGALLFQVVRKVPKAFLQRRPDGNGGWIWNTKDTRQVLYHLPSVRRAVADGTTIYVVEGEKDAEAVIRAGGVATTNPVGAGKWKPTYTESLKGAREVVIVADRDKPGRDHAWAVHDHLKGHVGSVMVVEPIVGKDVSDHLAAGHGLDLLDGVNERPSAVAGVSVTPDIEPESLRGAILSSARRSCIDGASFILDAPTEVQSVWGSGDLVAWSAGEPTLVNGPTGVGKTTIAQQVTLGRLGIRSEVLGMPVLADDRRVLYVAADRPPQASRSMRRMVGEEHRAVLAERLVVWRGPLPYDLQKEPEVLAAMAEQCGAGTLILDSLKDVAAKLSEDETGSKVNQAMQIACLAGVEVMALHHQRKKQQGGGKPKTLDDVYGSTWLTAGAGSVLLVWGQAGDAVVELSHLKQPVDAIGPLTLLHDHERGLTTVQDEVDLFQVVRTSNGLTAQGAARALFRNEAPEANEIERARRRLEALCKKGVVHREDPKRGGEGGSSAARYYPISRSEDAP